MGSKIGIVSLTNSAKSKIDLLPNNSSSCKGARPPKRAAGSRHRAGDPAVCWSVSSTGDHGSEGRWWWTHEDGSRTCLGAVSRNSALDARSFRVHPVSSVYRTGAASRRFGSSASRLGLEGAGGDEETRTPDPLLAKEMLCQLSYVPSRRNECGGRFWTRTRDLCLIRAVL